jgi:hypothetical protein
MLREAATRITTQVVVSGDIAQLPRILSSQLARENALLRQAAAAGQMDNRYRERAGSAASIGGAKDENCASGCAKCSEKRRRELPRKLLYPVISRSSPGDQLHQSAVVIRYIASEAVF